MERISIQEKRRLKNRRISTTPTQDGWGLTWNMYPNVPDIAHKPSEQVLMGDSSDSIPASSIEDYLGKANENVKHLSGWKRVNNLVADTGTIQTEAGEVHHESSKEPVAPLKGILRRPTKKFPGDPAPIRKRVAFALMGEDIPVGSRWTRVDRRLVNPEALEEAKERFEERMDCVIVLRILTKHEIQKLANRTKQIREAREDAPIATDSKNSDGAGADTHFTTSGSSKKLPNSESDPDHPSQNQSVRSSSLLSQPRSTSPVNSQFGDLDQNDQDIRESPEVPGEFPRGSGLSQIGYTHDKLHEETVKNSNAESSAFKSGTWKASIQQSSYWFQPDAETVTRTMKAPLTPSELFDLLKEKRFEILNEYDTSDSEPSERSHRLMRKRWGKDIHRGSPSPSVGGDSRYSDDDPPDGIDLHSRLLRRRPPRRRSSLIWKDRGVSNVNVVEEQGNPDQSPTSQEQLVEPEIPTAGYVPQTGQLDLVATTNGKEKKRDDETTRGLLMQFEQALSVHTRGPVDDWLKTTLAVKATEKNLEWELCDKSSATFAWVPWLASLESSASDISKGSVYAVQIATATEVLPSIFYEDKALLYTRAIGARKIGPERLQRNLRRLFRAYAGLLKGEATERLEHLASRLVRANSAPLARSIVEKLQNDRINAQFSPIECNIESSEEEDDGTSSRPVNEDAFEDLVTFRQFLVESEAFKTIHNQLQAFVIPSQPRADRTETVVEEVLDSDEDIGKSDVSRPPAQSKTIPTWHERFKKVSQALTMPYIEACIRVLTATGLHLDLDTLLLTRDHLLVNMGLLEPTLDQNKTRLRWRCRCGDPMYSDMIELREGGIAKLINNMQRSSGIKVQATAYSQQSRNQQYIVPRPDRWLRNAVTKIATAFGASSKSSSTCLPQHNAPCATTLSSTPNPTAAQKAVLYLSMCMHRTRRRKIIHQPRVDHLTTDRTLLTFLRAQYTSHRGRFLTFARLKSVEKITFIKFRLPTGGSVDVLRCISDSPDRCVCIPPPRTAGGEYDYAPSPPETHPPIAPEYLASLLTCMGDVGENDYWIRDQLPKRTCGKLQGRDGKPAVGWGIYFVEGWDREIISLLVLFMFVLASLLFGVLWWKFQFDLQGGFGVSAYMMAVCKILISVIVTRLENKG